MLEKFQKKLHLNNDNSNKKVVSVFHVKVHLIVSSTSKFCGR